MHSLHSILKQYWGYSSFRPMQEDIMNAVLAGHDTLALLPTGGGKSLCYQVPAMAMDGLCLVISPLIALMKDQVENLRSKQITAYAIYSGMSRKDVINTLKIAGESNCKFLYVSPERLETSLFKEYLPGLGVCLVAVDEAHCISQWGYDFRPPYLRIAALREELPGVPVLALTASATQNVQIDICEKLRPTEAPGNEWKIFRQSFERPNLSYSVFRVDSPINKIHDILSKVSGTAIIYCKSRRRTKEISDLLRLQQVSSDFYHAGLVQEERSSKQEDWIKNKTRVIVCTNAFGMGIDKPDVRVVIHVDVPDCLENYYQEAGRAGRDGKTAYAVLLYDEKSLQTLSEQGLLRFPELKEIREVYQAAANYLQVHTGEGEGVYYDFDLQDFTKKFKLNSFTTLYALKALEQEGWLAFNEQVFLPSFVQFIAGKDYLFQFEQNNSALEPLIKSLLRTYEGIFDQPTAIYEKQLGGLLKNDPALIKKQLIELERNGVIRYQPQKETPQVLWLRNRVRMEELRINMEAYKIRKEEFQQRVRQMAKFVTEESECRSVIIGRYFGDEKIKACGICDNCLRKKNLRFSDADFEKLLQQILDTVADQKIHTSELLQQLRGTKKENAWKVIEFLQAENKLDVDGEGWVRLIS